MTVADGCRFDTKLMGVACAHTIHQRDDIIAQKFSFRITEQEIGETVLRQCGWDVRFVPKTDLRGMPGLALDALLRSG